MLLKNAAGRNRIYLSPPDMAGAEKSLLNQAFDSNWVAPLGPFVEEFEQDLSAQMAGRPVVVLSSGTAAIHLALIRLGVGRGDVVLVQSFTFCATANPVAYLGASIAFVGSEPDTWNMCPDSLEGAIKDLMAKGKKPKAFIPVHLYGVPAKLSELLAISRKYQVPMIEDSAESLGSTYRGQPAGAFGDFGILSFNGNKIITTSGGGALVCPNADEYKTVKHLATQAREPAPYYLHSQIGYNYRLSNLCAAVGVGQLRQIQSKVERRRMIYEKYRNELGDLLHFLDSQENNFENRWLTVATINNQRTKFVSALRLVEMMEARNIECRPLWKPLHTQPVFEAAPYYGSGIETDLFETGLCLPSGSSLSDEAQRFVIQSVRDSLGASL